MTAGVHISTPQETPSRPDFQARFKGLADATQVAAVEGALSIVLAQREAVSPDVRAAAEKFLIGLFEHRP
jgi:hypothetical protein